MDMAETSNGPCISPIFLKTSQYAVSPEKKNLEDSPMTAKLPHKHVFLSNGVLDVQCFVGVKTISTCLPAGLLIRKLCHQSISSQLVIPLCDSNFFTPRGTSLDKRHEMYHIFKDINYSYQSFELPMRSTVFKSR